MAPGEPNNFNGNEDFIMMNFGSSRRWNDEGSSRRMRGIVEIAGSTPLGSIALEQNTYSVGEGAGGIDIAIVRSGGNLSSPASVQYRADSGTATLGSDFTATEGTISFAAGETRKIVRVPIQNDQIDEPNESFSFVIQSPTGANLGTIRTANVTIIDDDNSLLTVNPVRANESSSEALITLTRGSGIGTASVDFATQDGTALAPGDYQNTSGTVTFAEGETSKTLRIAVTNDSVAEPNETFQVNFSNPVNLTLGSPSVAVTLVDDDPGQFVRETVISGLLAPTAFARTPVGGPALMFIAEKSGVVKVAENNSVVGAPFIDLSPEVNNVRDRGLLGIAVHPNFYSGSPYVYLAYTYDPPEAFLNTNPSTSLDDPDQFGNRPVRVVRIKADAAAGFRRAVPTTDPDRQVVILGRNSTWANTSRPDGNSTTNLSIPESGRNPDGSYIEDYIKTDSESHTVGQLAFGADGALYVSIGDGTSYNAVDPRTVSVLNPDSLSGKILRVDPLTGQGFADNPFFNGNANANRSKVWNLGLRNPFRFTMQPGTSTPFIGDVGWNSWEEVNVGTRGANFGWPGYEGGNATNQVQSQYYNNVNAIRTFVDGNPSVTAPIYGRRHSEGARAIIMGDFYDGNTFSSVYSGALFVADVNEGTVDALTLDSQNRVTAVRRFDSGVQGLVYLETGPDGNLYFVNIGNGTIGRWRPLP
jgi:glucose/arabinose dehydrogenase